MMSGVHDSVVRLRISREMKRSVKVLAAERHMGLSELLRQLIRNELKRTDQ